MKPDETAPYTPEELFGIAVKMIARLRVPSEYRDDAVQEFVLAAMEAPRRAVANVRAYQVSTGRGAALHFVRGEREHSNFALAACPRGAVRVSLDMPVEGMDGEPTTLAETIPDENAPEPGGGMMERERKAEIQAALSVLSPTDSAVLSAVALEGMTQEQAASALNMTRRQVQCAMGRARSAMTTVLDGGDWGA